jgi:hypothetical protein
MPRSRRISVRLSDDEFRRVKEICCQDGSDVSYVVRQALNAFLTCKPAQGSNHGPPKRSAPPQGIISRTAPYLAWGSGDPRVRLRDLYAETLAASFALKELFPRTKGPKEIYQALLPLVDISEWTRV